MEIFPRINANTPDTAPLPCMCVYWWQLHSRNRTQEYFVEVPHCHHPASSRLARTCQIVVWLKLDHRELGRYLQKHVSVRIVLGQINQGVWCNLIHRSRETTEDLEMWWSRSHQKVIVSPLGQSNIYLNQLNRERFWCKLCLNALSVLKTLYAMNLLDRKIWV